MKKIFCFLMIAILCCSFMISPAFAINDPMSTINFNNVYPTFSYQDKVFNDYIVVNQGSSTTLYTFYDKNNYSSTNNVDFIFYVYASPSYGRYLRSGLRKNIEDYSSQYILGIYTYTEDTNAWTEVSYKWAQSEDLIQIKDGVSFIEYSSKDVINKDDGTIFFEAPPTEVTLAEAIQMIVEQEIPVTREIIQSQMMTIVLCGVGCLALLISLVLLVKVLRRYLLQ